MRRQFNQILYFLLIIFWLPSLAEARVFMFENESMAPYINFRTGVSSMGSEPYRWQSASTYSGDDVSLIYGGEFGIYFRGSSLGVSLGVLVQTFDPVTGGRASNAAGTSLYTVDVEGMSYGPQLSFDYQLSKTKNYLWKLIVGGGYQFSKIENTYTMSATGQALVGGQTSLTENYKQASVFGMLAISTEFIMSGSTTMSITAGYHHNFGQEWNYGQGVRNFAGTHNQSDKVLFEDGANKTINWNYPFVQLGFQFYVDTVR